MKFDVGYVVLCACFMGSMALWADTYRLVGLWVQALGGRDGPKLSPKHDLENAPAPELVDGNIEAMLGRRQFLFIYFYSPSCGHCNQFNPDFSYVSRLYQADETLQVLKTNGIANKRLAQLFSVAHFPTLKLVDFATKQIFTFEGTRSVDAISEFIHRHTQCVPNYEPLISVVLELDDASFSQLRQQSVDLVVAFLALSGANSIWRNVHYPDHFFQQLAKEYAGAVTFATVNVNDPSTAGIVRAFRVSNTPSVAYLARNGAVSVHLTAEKGAHSGLSEDQCRAFIQDCALGAHAEGWYQSLEELQNSAAMDEHDTDYFSALDLEYQQMLHEASL